MDKDYNTRLNWFTSRVGKRIYPDKTVCNCDYCNKMLNEGIIVENQMEALHLTYHSFDLKINYTDKKHVL
jgi:hypothetical protein